MFISYVWTYPGHLEFHVNTNPAAPPPIHAENASSRDRLAMEAPVKHILSALGRFGISAPVRQHTGFANRHLR